MNSFAGRDERRADDRKKDERINKAKQLGQLFLMFTNTFCHLMNG